MSDRSRVGSSSKPAIIQQDNINQDVENRIPAVAQNIEKATSLRERKISKGSRLYSSGIVLIFLLPPVGITLLIIAVLQDKKSSKTISIPNIIIPNDIKEEDKAKLKTINKFVDEITSAIYKEDIIKISKLISGYIATTIEKVDKKGKKYLTELEKFKSSLVEITKKQNSSQEILDILEGYMHVKLTVLEQLNIENLNMVLTNIQKLDIYAGENNKLPKQIIDKMAEIVQDKAEHYPPKGKGLYEDMDTNGADDSEHADVRTIGGNLPGFEDYLFNGPFDLTKLVENTQNKTTR